LKDSAACFIILPPVENIMFRLTPTPYSGANKSLVRPGSKQATATEDFEFNISYL